MQTIRFPIRPLNLYKQSDFMIWVWDGVGKYWNGRRRGEGSNALLGNGTQALPIPNEFARKYLLTATLAMLARRFFRPDLDRRHDDSRFGPYGTQHVMFSPAVTPSPRGPRRPVRVRE